MKLSIVTINYNNVEDLRKPWRQWRLRLSLSLSMWWWMVHQQKDHQTLFVGVPNLCMFNEIWNLL